jgi:hypothetical protein
MARLLLLFFAVNYQPTTSRTRSKSAPPTVRLTKEQPNARCSAAVFRCFCGKSASIAKTALPPKAVSARSFAGIPMSAMILEDFVVYKFNKCLLV